MTARVKFGRRDFLGRGTAAAAALGAAVVPGLGVAAGAEDSPNALIGKGSKSVGALAYGDFAGRLGQRFMVSAPERRVALTLLEASGCSASARACLPAGGVRQEPFSLLFAAPTGTLFESGTYQFSHPDLGRMKLFTHQVGAATAGWAVQYQVVFA